jgi:hypothetical protein
MSIIPENELDLFKDEALRTRTSYVCRGLYNGKPVAIKILLNVNEPPRETLVGWMIANEIVR